jgi:NAD(P)-dependent dehydrogenase (short-subunit alcohol dehydrogenase family)
MGILNKFSLKDRMAIVTGSGSGIGKAIAVGFARAGANIAVVEISPDAGMATVDEIRALGRRALPLAADVLDTGQVDELVAKTMTEFGKIDILVNNVGGTRKSRRVPVVDMKEEVWDMIIDLNLKSTFLCTKAVAKVMTEHKKGNVINIASVAGLRPYPSQPPYGASKAALINFTQTMAVQLAPYNIRVNAIAPGTITTPSAGYLGDREERARKRGTLMRRAGRVEDTVPAAIYLASDASSYVTGVTIEITGGPPFAAFLLEEAEGEFQLAQKSGK